VLLGSHLSIAGGPDKALVAAAAYGFDTVAMFLRNQRQWRSPTLAEKTVRDFRRARRRLGIRVVVAHGSYLVNLAGKPSVRRRSKAALREELTRCGRLGIEYFVLHPGSNPDLNEGVRLIAEAISQAIATCPHRKPKLLLETTSGAGNTIGGKFDHLAAILRLIERPRRIGVCLDTCHVFAAGYDLRSPNAYRRTMKEFDEALGIEHLKAIHLNDSLGELGSRRDRHAHIGHGHIGRKGFANLINDRRLADVPMILETPKGPGPRGRDWDAVNAAALRKLLRT